MQGLSHAEAVENCDRVLQEAGLADRADDPMHSFSGGMKRLLNLACGIVHRPPVLLLDEPTVGVDLQSREQLLTRIRHYADAGGAGIFNTPHLEEAQHLSGPVLPLSARKPGARGRTPDGI